VNVEWFELSRHVFSPMKPSSEPTGKNYGLRSD